jgi:hypothetical protein
MAMKMKWKEFRNPRNARDGCNLGMHSKKLYLEVFMISRMNLKRVITYLPPK